jgi:hypothetical protein
VVVRQPQLLQRFAPWIYTLQPTLWEEIRAMATKATDGPRIDWEAVGKYANLDDVVRALPPDRAAQLLAAVVPPEKLIQAIGLDRLVETSGAEPVVEALLKHFSAEQLQELLRRKQG